MQTTKKSYSEKLLDPRWQKKRLEIFQRDDFSCCKCKHKETTLHVHHIRYIKGAQPWEYENSDLATLCKDCHMIVEKFKRLADYSNIQIRRYERWDVEDGYCMFIKIPAISFADIPYDCQIISFINGHPVDVIPFHFNELDFFSSKQVPMDL